MHVASNDDSPPTAAEGETPPAVVVDESIAADVELVLLRRFVSETIRHLGPVVLAQAQHIMSPANTSLEPVPASQHSSGLAVPPAQSGPPSPGSKLPQALSVTVATPPLTPRTDTLLAACPTILTVQTITTTGNQTLASLAGGGRSPSAILSNIVDTFCRALVSAADEACEQYSSRGEDRGHHGGAAVSPIAHFFGVSLPKVAGRLHQQVAGSALTPRSPGCTPRPGNANQKSASSFYTGGTSWQTYQHQPLEAVQGDDDVDHDGAVTSWLQETFSTVGSGGKRLGQGRKETSGGASMKRSVTRMTGFSSRQGAEAEHGGAVAPSLPTPTGDKPRAEGAQPFRKLSSPPPGSPQDDSLSPTGKKVRGLSVGFKDRVEVQPAVDDESRRRGSTNSSVSNSDDAAGMPGNHSIGEDPFANVASLPLGESPAVGALKPIPSRRGSQYFRRQSAASAMGQSFTMDAQGGGGSGAFAVQTLNPTDMIKHRLDALGVPWLDVDNVDFNIFDTCEKIDAGEITLSTTKAVAAAAAAGGGGSQLPPTASLLSSRHIFRYVCVNVMLRYSFIDTLKIDLKKLYAFLAAVENLYNPENPYHNAQHAADVLQTSHIYLLTNNVFENFFDREILCLLLAALVHDVGHLGVNNQFLIKIHHPLAVLYNGLSPLENMHSILAFRLLEQDALNFLHGSDVWSAEDYEELEAKVVEMVIATDMKYHGNALTIAQDLFKEGFAVEDGDVDKLIKLIIHAADLSNPMKPFAVYQNWGERVISEFFSQGAAEAERGLPISPNFDRNSMKFPEMQVGFINFVVKPYANAMSPILPPEWLDRLQSNLEYMQKCVGKPYERRDVLLEACKNPWVDRWSRVAPLIFNISPSSSPTTASEVTSVEPSPKTIVGLHQPPTASALPETTSSSRVPAQASPSLPSRPGSSVSMAPVVSLLTDNQIRFCMNTYEATQLFIQRATNAHRENRLCDKLSVTDHQRGFSVALVKQLVKTFEQIAATRKCFGGKAAMLVNRALEDISALLVPQSGTSSGDSQSASVNATTVIDVDRVDMEMVQFRRLLREPNACLKLYKTCWLAGFAPPGFQPASSRLPPISPKERDVYRETLRQCVSTYAAVVDGLLGGASTSSAGPLFGQRAIGMPPATPPLGHDEGRGRGLYASAAGAFGGMGAILIGASRASSAEPVFSDVPLTVVVPPGRFSAPLVATSAKLPSQSATRSPLENKHLHNEGDGTSPTTSPPAYAAPTYLSTDHRKTLPPLPFIDRGTPEPQSSSNNTSPQRSSSRVPLVTLEPIDGYTNQRDTYGGPASDDEDERGVASDDEEDEGKGSDGEDERGTPPGLKKLERQAQLHFQQSDDQWRMTQTDDGSPRSLGLASMGSFRNSKHLRAGGTPAGTSMLKDDGMADVGNSSSTSQPGSRGAHLPDMGAVSITAGIPNAYFLPPGSPHSIGQGLRPRSPPTAHASPNSGNLNISYTQQPPSGIVNPLSNASMDALSFIPMVHSVDPSPRSRMGAQSSPPPAMSLEFMQFTGAPFPQNLGAAGAAPVHNRPSPSVEVLNDVDAHNLLQLELLLLHHTTHSAAVQKHHPRNLTTSEAGLHPPHHRSLHSPLHGGAEQSSNVADPGNQSSSSGQHTRSSGGASTTSRNDHSQPLRTNHAQQTTPVPGSSPATYRSMSPDNAMRLVEDGDLPQRTTSMQSITDHLQRAAASITEVPLPTVGLPLAITTVFSSPPPASLSHSPKRRSGRGAAGSQRSLPRVESPLSSPAYRQQLAEMVVNGMESRTFGSSTGSPTNAAASLSAHSPPPSLTPVQIHSIDEGCLVPDVYRASAAGSFRHTVASAQGSFRTGGASTGGR